MDLEGREARTASRGVAMWMKCCTENGRAFCKVTLFDRIHCQLWVERKMRLTQVIEYYIPENFQKRSETRVPSEEGGKIIPFPPPQHSQPEPEPLYFRQ